MIGATMKDDRCHHCDRPHATDEEWETVEEDTRDDLCWSGGRYCCVEGVDWRKLALEAEAECVKLREENSFLQKHIHNQQAAIDEYLSVSKRII